MGLIGEFPNLEEIEQTVLDKLKKYPEYKERMESKDLTRKIPVYENDFYMFPQMWGSTTLGFGGVGGCAMTQAYTVVVWNRVLEYSFVFFDGRLAYAVKSPNEKFLNDLRSFDMTECYKANKYGKIIENNGM